MTLRALKYVRQQSNAAPKLCHLELSSPEALQQLRTATSCAYVLSVGDADALRTFRELVLDRGRKHKAKPLGQLLLGKDKMPLIDGAFTAAGQLERSIRTLLSNAARVDESNVYFIATADPIFDELWTKAQTQRPQKKPAAQGSQADWPTHLDDHELARRMLDLSPELEVPPELRQTYIGNSSEVKMVHRLTMMAAQSEEPVLILGDTGTGKELVAQSIHKYGARANGPFKTINCGAIPAELFESELFGHLKGSYTGAHENRGGLWQAADLGTLFLDEIGDLSLSHQAKILRALQEERIKPIGSTYDIEVSARIVAATNRDLLAMVEAGLFRDDLYYRIRHILIPTPALRNHPTDIPELAEALWARLINDKSNRLPKAILNDLQAYRWPGNVRELKSVLSCLFTYFGKAGLSVEHLKGAWAILGQSGTARPAALTNSTIVLHSAECLRHLRRADEIVRALKVTARPLLVQKKRLDRKSATEMNRGLQRHLYELEMLCLHPLFFHGEDTYQTIYRLKGKLIDFTALVRQDNMAGYRHWKENVSPVYKEVTAALFKEVQSLLKKL